MSQQYSVRQCIQQRCGTDLRRASARFGQIAPNGSIPIVLTPRKRFLGMFITIPTGVAAIVQKWGRHDGEWRPGTHFAGPNVRVAYLVTKQACTYNYDVVSCPTKDNVMVEVDTTIVFRIVNATDFVYKLGATKFDEMLRAVSEEAIRSMVRLVEHKDIYELRGSGADELLKILNDKFELFGVMFVNTTITNVKLPSGVATALQNTTTLRQNMSEHQKSHEFQLKLLHDKHDLALNNNTLKNERIEAELTATLHRHQIELEKSKDAAYRALQVAIINTEEKLSVARKQAEMQLQNEKVEQETKAEVMAKTAEAKIRQQKLEAEHWGEHEIIKSEARKLEAEMKAKQLLVEAEAEEHASGCLREARNHELQLAMMSALDNIARSGKVLVNGSCGQQIVSAISSVDGGNQMTTLL